MSFKIAFVTHLWNDYFQQLVHGIQRHAGERNVAIRGFLIDRKCSAQFIEQTSIQSLLSWEPEGIISGLRDDELSSLLSRLPDRVPVVNTVRSTPSARVAVITGCRLAVIKSVFDFFSRIKIKSVSFFLAETDTDNVQVGKMISQVNPKFDKSRFLLVEPLDVAVVENPLASIDPIPTRIENWLRSLPKPAGVYCFQLGGADYLSRVASRLAIGVNKDLHLAGVEFPNIFNCNTDLSGCIRPYAEQIGVQSLKLLTRMLNGYPAPHSIIRIPAIEVRAFHVAEFMNLSRDIDAAMDFIESNACQGISVDEVISRTQYCSRMTFYKEFIRRIGKTPGEVIFQRKLDEACKLLLTTDLSLETISSKCGFGGASSLSRAFRKSLGSSPSNFKLIHRSSEKGVKKVSN